MIAPDVSEISAAVVRAMSMAHCRPLPFSHWLPADVLPRATIADVIALPVPPPHIRDTKGKRETHNATRCYFAGDILAGEPAASALAQSFQCPVVVRAIETASGAVLGGSLLRIEYCQDSEDFWLEPHRDIAVKLLTLIIYLSTPPAGQDWGTDLYHGDLRPAGRAPAAAGHGLMFRPGSDTWHGFERRPIAGVRRSLIVNYVTREWRAVRELAFPDQPVR